VLFYGAEAWSLRRKEEFCWRELKFECSGGYHGVSLRDRKRTVRISVLKWEWRVLLIRFLKPDYDGTVMWNGEKKT